MAPFSLPVKLFKEYRQLFDQMQECQAILGDKDEEKEMVDIAKEEMEGIEEQIDEQAEEIVEAILPKSDADARNCTMEIMQAAGGSESSLFAEDLYNMYKNYCRVMGFRFKELEF